MGAMGGTGSLTCMQQIGEELESGAGNTGEGAERGVVRIKGWEHKPEQRIEQWKGIGVARKGK